VDRKAVDVTTHLRTRAAQAGALLAVVAGGIAVAPAVALADPPQVQITSLPTDVLSGSSVTMQYTVRAAGNGGGQGDGGKVSVNIQVSGDGIKCKSGCGQISQVDGNGSSFNAQLTAPTVNPGDTKTANITITATVQGEDPATTSQAVNVKGPDKPQTVTSVSGKVKDQNGKAIAGASVAMKDSSGTPFAATTNGSGGYSFNSSDSKPIAPGTITVGALKDGYDTATVQVQATAGKSVNVPLTLKLLEATASASPSASASTSASAEATEEATTDEPTTEDSAAANADTKNTSADQGSGSGSLLFILLGGLLVAAGVGAIVLVLMRRKNTGGDGPDDDPTAMGGGGGVVPPSQGRFNDATRVASPMGAGGSPTMVAPRAASSPMADAPTMLQRPVEDEFPDPYGAPAPRPGNQYGGGWDDQPAGGQPYGGASPQNDGYGAATSVYGAAPSGGTGTYGAAPAGGGQQYGATNQYGGGPQQRYDEPTGMYRPEPGADDYDDYDQRGAQYGGGSGGGGTYGGSQYGAGGYDDNAGGYDQGGYDQPGGNGYGAQGGGTYGSAAPAGGTYGSAAPAGGQYGGTGQYGGGAGGGYDEYDQAGYDQQRAGGQYGGGAYGGNGQYGAGYEDDGRGGYDQGGYDQRGGRGQAQPTHPGQRRPAEWDN
jgi:hypothetical protein